jgi:hypothetical protein
VWLAAAGPLMPLPGVLEAAAACLPPWLARCAAAAAVAAAFATATAATHGLPAYALVQLSPCSGVAVNLPLAFFAGYALFYTALETFAGLTWSAIVGLPLLLTATAFQAQVSGPGGRAPLPLLASTQRRGRPSRRTATAPPPPHQCRRRRATPCHQVPNAGWWALAVQVVSWYMQIHPGHAVFEGRKPALLDSLAQVRAARAGAARVG